MNKVAASKRELLYRGGQRKRLLPDYYKKIEALLDVRAHDLAFLQLDATDAIIRPFWSEQKIVHTTYTNVPVAELAGHIQELKNKKQSLYIFIDTDWECCGTFLCSSHLLREDFCFGPAVTDTIAFVTEGLTEMIDIDCNEERGEWFLNIRHCRMPAQV